MSHQDLWQGMPEYTHEDLEPEQSVKVHFASKEDREAFSKLIDQKITDKTRSLWYPPQEIGHYTDKRYSSPVVVPKYPVYIISKGRWETRLTSRALEYMRVPYRIVVEPQEYDQYASVIDPAKILVLPFSNLGQGSIPARNWVWEHSINEGHSKHWILDDNLDGFFRYQNNLKVPVDSGAVLCAAEDFTDRFENVALSGPQYFHFVSRKEGGIKPYKLNTRIYSCILINNEIPYRWRGKYNEDTDLSLRALKDGWCTILFNAFLADKIQTLTMKGGNTDELYKDDGRLKMAQSLVDQHPDVVKITKKFGRFQHQVDYRPFAKNELKLKEGLVIEEGTNNYGMEFLRDQPPFRLRTGNLVRPS